MIQIENVSRAFARVQALRGVSLTLRDGERVAFVGTNGSGKTTLMRAVLGLLRVEGRVLVDGVDPARDPARVLTQMAYIPQVAPPLEAPVGEVVRAFGALRGIATAAVEERLAAFGLTLATMADKRLRDLSGGQKQKLLSALALSTDARVLVCDEPTANLDPVARTAFFDAVHARPPGSTLILCSHRIDEVSHLVDRVVELQDGRVVQDGALVAHLHAEALFRVEVQVNDVPGAELLAGELRGLGFRTVGLGRMAAHLGQAQKLAVVSRLVRERGELLADLAISEAEGAATGARNGRAA